ncbi:hypothetical protein FRC05_001515 [Tulasnella sp. 425]|nr:hypothetical protein FRC05_001515 [Tulasnella sp. 425]
MPPVVPAAPRSTPESPADNVTVSCPLVNLLPKLITQILLQLKINDILRVRQTCRHLFKQTKSQKLWASIAQQLLHSPEIIWPSWGLPLDAIPAETIEDLVFRTGRLTEMQRTLWIDDSNKEIRTSFEGLIVRPYDSPMGLHLIRGRWLLVQLNDFTLELWDLDNTTYAHPAATCSQLGGFVDGIVHAESGGNIEIVISTTSFQTYKFAPVLPFKHDPRPSSPNLTVVNSTEGYSSLKARAGQLLAFGASSGNNLRTCIVDESTGNEVELTIGPDVKEVPTQKTLDILIQGDVIFVARHRNLQLYATSDVEQALAHHNPTSSSIRPFQSLTYPGTPLLHNPKFHPNIPSYIKAPRGSIAITHFVDQYWHAFIVQPQGPQADSLHRNYEVLNLYALSRCIDPIYGTSVGDNGYRSAILTPQSLSIHLAKLWENERDDIHMPVLWQIPDAEVDLPRPGCIAFDEATGICVAGMGSGRLWIGDAVTRREPKLSNIPDIQKPMV